MSAAKDYATDLRRHYNSVRNRLWQPAVRIVEPVEVVEPPPPSPPHLPPQAIVRDILDVASEDFESEPVETPKVPSVVFARRTVAMCAERHGVTYNDIMSPRRNKKIVIARMEAVWRVKMGTTWSLPRIGRFFGDRDHTTILHSVRTHQAKVDRGEA